ncbi:hypothetical protein [Dyella lutea]|uniref:Uncharacterized protein n=1 Tax=Dyella lutea TaxID=2950441 RepID=A0ABT1FFE3_9GAMM|nr:hypothetical protein [Dyella lutea]MCP1375133.1 hypothetical protein [Dyella lutea]
MRACVAVDRHAAVDGAEAAIVWLMAASGSNQAKAMAGRRRWQQSDNTLTGDIIDLR